MKTILISSLLFVIIAACTHKAFDRVYCQGACPNNQTCILGTCGCNEKQKQIGEYCFHRTPITQIGPGSGGVFLEIDTNTCGKPNSYFMFELNLEEARFRDTNTFVFFGSDFYRYIPLTEYEAVAGFSNTVGNFSKGNDSLYRFGTYENDINYGPCTNCLPRINNELILKGYFNKTIDTVTMQYFFSCCNGALKDTCVKKFALLR
jgi:hypothetical protein